MNDPKEALKTRPKHVALVALGPSYYEFIREAVGRKDHSVPFDEVWTINRGFQAVRHDKVFVMDDLRWIEQHDFTYAEALKKHDKPLITCFQYDDYPQSVAYPINMVIKRLEDDLLNNTVAYAIAYALVTQVECLSIYGADFYYPDVQLREEGSQACAYLLGGARFFGMKFRLPQSTTLLGANQVKIDPKTGQACRPLYGYHRRIQLVDPPQHAFAQYIKEIQGRPDDAGRFNLTFGPQQVEKDDERVRASESSRLQAGPGNEPSSPGIDETLSAAVLRAESANLREDGAALVGRGEQDQGRSGVVLPGSGEGHVGPDSGGNGTGQGAGALSFAGYKWGFEFGEGLEENDEAKTTEEIHPEEEVRGTLADSD